MHNAPQLLLKTRCLNRPRTSSISSFPSKSSCFTSVSYRWTWNFPHDNYKLPRCNSSSMNVSGSVIQTGLLFFAVYRISQWARHRRILRPRVCSRNTNTITRTEPRVRLYTRADTHTYFVYLFGRRRQTATATSQMSSGADVAVTRVAGDSPMFRFSRRLPTARAILRVRRADGPHGAASQ